MSLSEKPLLPKSALPCHYHDDCVARQEGKCRILRSNNFGGRDCPFYKNAAHIKADQKLIQNRRAAKSSNR